ncbi:hypothetical protein B7494_g5358 [Chlorociboria aeruginascens]|nr:hypothetical protein B7494_g5358 [Chlorociboria aeruginascens]
MAMNVTSKTAIVTGAGSGINFSFAKLLLEKGCNVLIADLALRPEAEALLSSYPLSSTGAKAFFQQTDVADWAQLDTMFSIALEKFGGVDIVCPGAGIYEPEWTNFWHPPGAPPSRDNPSQSRYALLDINITHPIRVTQQAISHFLCVKKPGVVVHISSIAGQVVFFPTPMYVASKHAISGFVGSLAPLEFPAVNIPKIRVVAVAPALIKTPLWTDHPEKMQFIDEEKAVDEDRDGWVTADDVAKVMLDLVQKEENIGGTILEIGKTIRKVGLINDPGPNSARNGVPYKKIVLDGTWKSLEERLGSD